MRFGTRRKSPTARAIWATALALVCGGALFVMSALLLQPFSNLVNLLNTGSSFSWRVAGATFFVSLIVGPLWLFFFVLFEVAKTGLVALLDVKPKQPVRPSPRKSALAAIRRRIRAK